MHLRTDMPRGGMISWLTRINSRMELITTMKSNLKTTTDILMIQQREDKSDLLNRETMYPDRPRAYIFSNISQVKRQTKKRFVYSWNIQSFHSISMDLDQWECSTLNSLRQSAMIVFFSPGNRQAREADDGAQWPERKCWETRGSQSARTSTETCRYFGTFFSWICSTSKWIIVTLF